LAIFFEMMQVKREFEERRKFEEDKKRAEGF
jgi:hypothetical protein